MLIVKFVKQVQKEQQFWKAILRNRLADVIIAYRTMIDDRDIVKILFLRSWGKEVTVLMCSWKLQRPYDQNVVKLMFVKKRQRDIRFRRLL